MVSTVPERVAVWVGSVRVCAQLGRERVKTTNPAAPRIAFTPFVYLSYLGIAWFFELPWLTEPSR